MPNEEQYELKCTNPDWVARLEVNVDKERERAKQLADLSHNYHELLYAVENKCPGETRHQTALRYIREQESRISQAAKISELSNAREDRISRCRERITDD